MANTPIGRTSVLYLLDANVLIDANRDYYPIHRVPEFWDWLHAKEWLMEKNEKACSEWIYSYIGIESRKELKTSEEARELFNRLKASFEAWRNQ